MLGDVVNGLKQLGDAKFIYSEVNTVLQLFIVPTSGATAKRGISAFTL